MNTYAAASGRGGRVPPALPPFWRLTRVYEEGRCTGGPLRPAASCALAVLQKSCCSSSPAAGHVIHRLPCLRATEQNNGYCCKISGRKLFSHTFQWFSFRPVSAVISQQNLIHFVQSPVYLQFPPSFYSIDSASSNRPPPSLKLSDFKILYHSSRIKSSRESTKGWRRLSTSRSFFTRS